VSENTEAHNRHMCNKHNDMKEESTELVVACAKNVPTEESDWEVRAQSSTEEINNAQKPA